MRQKTNDCWVWLCGDCHERVHNDAELRLRLKEVGQRAYMKKNNWNLDDWFRFCDKNYIN